MLIKELHAAHLLMISDKNNAAKRTAYKLLKQKTQSALRSMKDSRWMAKANEMQAAADKKDLKSFYSSLRAVYGPRDSGTIPVFSADGSKLLLDKKDVLNRWAEHFNNVLNQPSDFDGFLFDEIPQLDTAAPTSRSSDI